MISFFIALLRTSGSQNFRSITFPVILPVSAELRTVSFTQRSFRQIATLSSKLSHLTFFFLLAWLFHVFSCFKKMINFDLSHQNMLLSPVLYRTGLLSKLADRFMMLEKIVK